MKCSTLRGLIFTFSRVKQSIFFSKCREPLKRFWNPTNMSFKKLFPRILMSNFLELLRDEFSSCRMSRNPAIKPHLDDWISIFFDWSKEKKSMKGPFKETNKEFLWDYRQPWIAEHDCVIWPNRGFQTRALSLVALDSRKHSFSSHEYFSFWHLMGACSANPSD